MSSAVAIFSASASSSLFSNIFSLVFLFNLPVVGRRKWKWREKNPSRDESRARDESSVAATKWRFSSLCVTPCRGLKK